MPTFPTRAKGCFTCGLQGVRLFETDGQQLCGTCSRRRVSNRRNTVDVLVERMTRAEAIAASDPSPMQQYLEAQRVEAEFVQEVTDARYDLQSLLDDLKD